MMQRVYGLGVSTDLSHIALPVLQKTKLPADAGTLLRTAKGADNALHELTLFALHHAILHDILLEKDMAIKVDKHKEPCSYFRITAKGKATLFIEYSGKGPFASSLIELNALPGSHVTVFILQHLSEETTYIAQHVATADDATVTWIDCCLGSKLTLTETTSLLTGGARAEQYGLVFASGSQIMDLGSTAVHDGKATSNLVLKGAVTDAATAIYRGLITMHQGAAASNGYQKADILLLSKNAKAHVIPNLVIGNYDVKCSHGASIGRIDPDQLFYATSRGLSKKQATQLLVQGFFTPFLDRLDDAIKTNVQHAVQQKVGNDLL